MRKQIFFAAGITLFLVILGYGLYAFMFTEEPEKTSPPRELKKTTQIQTPEKQIVTPKPKVARNIEIVSVNGKVQRRRGAEAWMPLKKGDVLEMDETIQSAKNGSAVIDFDKTAVVEISQQSEFTVEEISSNVSRVRVNEGRLSADMVGETGAKLIVGTKGSNAKAEAVEGKFSVLADGKGQMAVATESGRVTLSANNESVVVEEGMQSVAQVDSVPTAPTSIPQSLFLKVGRPNIQVLRKKETVISGRTIPGAVVSINNVRMVVDETGRFSGTVPLQEGRNDLEVSAEHVSGMEKQRVVPGVMVDTRPPTVQSAVHWGSDEQNPSGP